MNVQKLRKENSLQEKNENEQINSMEFMTSALDKLETKLSYIEGRVDQVKKILERQDINIKNEILQIKQEILIDENNDSHFNGNN